MIQKGQDTITYDTRGTRDNCPTQYVNQPMVQDETRSITCDTRGTRVNQPNLHGDYSTPYGTRGTKDNYCKRCKSQ